MTNDIMIQVDHITKKFGKLKAVDDVSLTLKKGEIVCLIGPSGSGKSTGAAYIFSQLKMAGILTI